jgi:drug/metabolite transporter (DMT)-like permease
VSTAGYFLIGERGAGKHDAVGLTAAGLLIGAVPVFAVNPPWHLPTGRLGTVTELGGWHPPVWLALVALAVLSTVVPYLTGVSALRHLPSALASVLGLLEPLVATLLAWVLLGQALGPVQLAGAAILLGGAVLVQLAGPEQPPADVPAPV